MNIIFLEYNIIHIMTYCICKCDSYKRMGSALSLSHLVLFHLPSLLHACRLREKCFSSLLTRQQTVLWLVLPAVINGMAN